MKEMLKRALRTFIQTAVGYIATNIVCVLSDITDTDMIKTMLIGLAASAASAGLAAVMNMPKSAPDPESAELTYDADESGKIPFDTEGEENER